MFRVAVLTVSDRGSRGERPEDLSGEAIRAMLPPAEFAIAAYAIVPDERDAIARQLVDWADSAAIDLILTTGGTGLAPRDVTPEATLDVLDRQAPGLSEAMRASSLAITPHAMLSRGVAGLRGRVLIVNLPGSPKGVRETLATILPVLRHGIELARGVDSAHT